jgi:hypothetical protein
MKYASKIIPIMFVMMAILLSACSGGGENVSEGLKMPESPLLRLFERKSGRILYLGIDGNLYTINQAGEDLVPITTDFNSDAASPDYRGYSHFAWAPDSERIAFVGFDKQKIFINTVNADGSNLIEAYSSNNLIPIYLYWTSDSQFIGFLANRLATTELSMNYVSASGNADLTTIGTGQPYYWVWEPGEGTRLLAHIGGGEDAKVVMISPNEAQNREFDLTPSVFQAPAWSPDGNSLMLAIREERSDTNTLVVTNLQGGVQQRLAQVDDSVAFGWSPDGQWATYITSDRERGGVLGSLTVQNISDPEKSIQPEHGFVLAYFWAPDSKKLAYFTLELAPEDPDSTTQAQQSEYVALGLHTLDIKSGASTQLLYFIPTNEFFYQVISHFDQYQHSATIWSPDSENIVISGITSDGQSARIIIVPASGNLQQREIAEGVLAFWSWK